MNIKIETQLTIDREVYDTFAEVERLLRADDANSPFRIDELMQLVLADQSVESVIDTVNKFSQLALNGESVGESTKPNA
jgi:hypothetical protein